MKKQQNLLVGLALGAGLLALSGHATETRPEQQGDLAERVLALETELEVLRGESLGLAEELTANAQVVDELTAWVEAQADLAASLAATLDKAEEQGFTAGINFESRETLLAGWREVLSKRQKGLTGSVPEEADANGEDGTPQD